jgi:hypothetical protein
MVGWEGKGKGKAHLLLCECLVQQPCDDGEVAALIVRGEQDRVFVLGLRDGRHCVWSFGRSCVRACVRAAAEWGLKE